MESRSKFLKVRDCEKMPKYMIDILVSLVLSFEITDKNREKNTYLSMKDTLDYLKSFLDGYGLKEAFLNSVNSKEVINTYGHRQVVTYVGGEVFFQKNTLDDGYVLLEKFLNAHFSLSNDSLIQQALKGAMKLSLDDYLKGHYFRKTILEQGIEDAKKIEIAQKLLGYASHDFSVKWEEDWVTKVLMEFQRDGFVMDEACQRLLLVTLECFLHQCLLDSNQRSKVLLIFHGTVLEELNIPYTDVHTINLYALKRKEFLTSFEQEVSYLNGKVPVPMEEKEEEDFLAHVFEEVEEEKPLPKVEVKEKVQKSSRWNRQFFEYGAIFLVLIVLVLGIVVSQGESVFDQDHTENIAELQQQVLALYESENVPKKGITKEELSKLEKKLSKVGSSAEVQPYLNQVYALYDYVAMEEFLNKNFPEECLKYPVVDTDLEELQKLYQSLLTEYQPIFQERYELFINQYQDIQDAKSALRKLFQDDNLNYVRDGVTLAEKNKVYQMFVNLPQKQMLEQYEVAFTRVDTYIEKQKEEDKKQEEERRKEQELIQKSYVKIKGIPFISQKDSEVFNGCEAASLLMALQYYGFAKEYDLVSFAQIFPKHDSDPHQGFIYDIFKREPYDVVHWIAPDALTRYAKTYMNASDISGKEVSSISSYIDQGKPVIAYITDEFKPVKKWVGEVPLNMHVVLVVGYNTYNGSYVVYDPYWGELVVEKSKFETSYQILKYGVVVG